MWKMLYIHMLGYDVDFGHMEAVSLISAPKYPEKQVFSYICEFNYCILARKGKHAGLLVSLRIYYQTEI